MQNIKTEDGVNTIESFIRKRQSDIEYIEDIIKKVSTYQQATENIPNDIISKMFDPAYIIVDSLDDLLVVEGYNSDIFNRYTLKPYHSRLSTIVGTYKLEYEDFDGQFADMTFLRSNFVIEKISKIDFNKLKYKCYLERIVKINKQGKLYICFYFSLEMQDLNNQVKRYLANPVREIDMSRFTLRDDYRSVLYAMYATEEKLKTFFLNK